MHEKLSRPKHSEKAGTLLFSSWLWACAATAPAAAASLTDLRACVADAGDPKAIIVCEQREQTALKERISTLGAVIRKRLDERQRRLFNRNTNAWQAYFESEQALLGLTLEQRADGLGATLHSGAINRLYEQRERQLREHLHNLNQARKPVADQP